MNLDLFTANNEQAVCEQLSTGTFLLRHFACCVSGELLEAINTILLAAPLRHMSTPGGRCMSVAISNCGESGWVSDHHGYRYTHTDPQSQKPWPAMPAIMMQFAQSAAAEAGFHGFSPDACLINRYQPGAKMSLHQDKDERDMTAPIVSVSLGLPAIFLLGGMHRHDKPLGLTLIHGDVLVWGGADRLRFHGVMPLPDGQHELLNHSRINLTFRKTR